VLRFVVACLAIVPIDVSRSQIFVQVLGYLSFFISLFVSPFLHVYLCVTSVVVGWVN
jgi:hypothetical protein